MNAIPNTDSRISLRSAFPKMDNNNYYYLIIIIKIIIIIIIIIINCHWVFTRWQWLFYMYIKYEINLSREG